MELHTILGANGTIAKELLPILLSNNKEVRLVSRSPKSMQGVQTRQANVLNFEELYDALEGSSYVYMVIGLAYNHKIWQRDWLKIMQNVIRACKATKAKLIYFDNVYMYGKVNGVMTEETPYNPCSKKGKVRAEVARLLQTEMKAGTIDAIIVRAVDFYGPDVIEKSIIGMMVFANLKKGKSAQWLVNADLPRALSYVPDAAKGMYLLAISPNSYGQVWHLPTAQPTLTGREFIKLSVKYMHASDKVSVLPKWFLNLFGLFNKDIKEICEMLYQNEFPFQFSSEKFEKAFHFVPTSYEEGIKNTAESFLNN